MPRDLVRKGGLIYRSDYVSKSDESAFLHPGTDGLPFLELVFITDRLVIRSTRDPSKLINPKSPNLRSLDIFVSYARGTTFHAPAYRAAPLGPGGDVELRREPQNPHDKNAVQMLAPRASRPFAYVQRGKATAVARLMDAGVDIAGISLRGPGARRDDDSAFILLGPRRSLQQMWPMH